MCILHHISSILKKELSQCCYRDVHTGFLSQILIYDLADDFVDEQKEILAAIGREELSQLATEQLTMDDMIIVVVGDKQVILPELEELGYEIIELDEAGDEVSRL